MTTIAKQSSALRLDDVVDLLHSEEAVGKIGEVRQDLQAHGLAFDKGLAGFHTSAPQPVDRFEALVMTGLRNSFLRESQLQAMIPNALTYALAHVADQQGTLSREAVTTAFGPRAGALFDWLEQKLDHGARAVPTSREHLKYEKIPPQLVELIAKSARPSNLAQRMPVLAEVSRMFGGEQQLAGLKSGAVQHLFPTTATLFDALKENGLDPRQALVHGKVYSTNQDVMFRMRVAGWDIPTLSAHKVPQKNGEHDAGAYLDKILAGLDPKHDVGPRVLLLDEGGKLVKALHERYPEYAHLCVAVEQTDRGIQVLEEMQAHGVKLRCPVVSVARSGAKKQFESPMIGESIAHSIDNALAGMNKDLRIEPKEATIIGYGAVGKATADALRRRGFVVNVYDTDPAKMAQAKAEGCTPRARDEALARAHLLVSCTGRTTITPDEFAKLPNKAVLVNAASSNHELGMESVEDGPGYLTNDPQERYDDRGFRRTTFDGKDLVLGDLAGVDWNYSRVMRGDDGSERIVLKSGYVVNMDEDIPPEFIQLTRGLLLGACLQAVSEGKPGLVDVRKDVQDFVVARTSKHLASAGLSLTAPDFRGLPAAES